MWPDIEKVKLSEKIPDAVLRLPRTMERFEASRFFAGHVLTSLESRKLQTKSWLNWASIVALPSAAVDNPLHLDFAEISLGDEWLRSQERIELYADPLLVVLFELRNYEVHFEFRTGKIGNFRTIVESGAEQKEYDFGDAVFISAIDFISLSRLKNIQSGRSSITVEMVNWFNRQAEIWPAAYLIGVARERYARYIARFLKRNGIG